ncbi:hypothetical protein DH2020_040228 [Rehmannia glutinosa]|uniref:Uncharacterized protein n=1 Tax=Rehmannia glutinosa TaxID=99300 RepID=A0ABR0UTT2_REHGL
MEQELDDLEFLLPSELLTDDDLLTDFETDVLKTGRIDDFGFGFGNSCGFSSDLSSPVESVTGTAETVSDEDDFVTELKRKFTQYSLQDATDKGLKLSGSPQSTLCGFRPGSRGSPNSVSRVSSPPEAKDALSWDLLYAAAEEVARLRMVAETAAFYSTKPITVTVPQQKPRPPSVFYPNQSQTQAHVSYQQLQAAKFQQMKQHQMMNNGVLGQSTMDYQIQNERRNGGGERAYGLSMSSWPTLQQSHQQHQPGSAMKAVFLVETGAKKERVGTGVFMPRRFGSNPTDPRKKPDRFDSIDTQVQHRGLGSFSTDYDAVLKHRNTVMMANQRRNRPQPLMNQEFRLPQEWTY